MLALYRGFLRRWRYVKDPRWLETVATSGPAVMGLTLGMSSPHGIGAGDCDEATVALGALAAAVGIEPRIVVTGNPITGRPSHVYPEMHIPRIGWLPFDAVAWPHTGPGKHPPAKWRRRFDLSGRKIVYPIKRR